MKATKLLRNKLGLTQSEMAKYLSITRSQLTMYENHKRDLPSFALQKIVAMELYFTQIPKKNKIS